MKYVRGFLFVLGIMFFGVTTKMEADGDAILAVFIFYGFFGLSILIGWYEVRRLLLDLRGK